MNLWVEHVRKTTGLILDVGAYTGIYTLLSHQVNETPTRLIYAFEPLGRICERLRENVQYNVGNDTNVVIVNSGLSNITGDVELSITNNIPLPSGSSLNPTKQVKATEHITVHTGDFWFKHERDVIGLIKIDVEHHELEVLQGLGTKLKQNHPTCFIEILECGKLYEILQYMGTLGYNSCNHINDEAETTMQIPMQANITELNNTNISGGRNFIFEKTQ